MQNPVQAIPGKQVVLSKGRIVTAVGLALLADALQYFFALIPGVDQGVDLAAALAIIGLIGFHPLLLPTFLVELIPGVDLLPTWTGCVMLVIALRKRAQAANEPPKIIVHPPGT
ncbi:MAG TPA: hypothetical protein VGE41_11590 [Verrucomicrobiae bacterium]|jgi:hypothetical protein